MENKRTLKQRLARLHIFTVLACALVAIALVRIDWCGTCYSHPTRDGLCEHHLCHGWPTPFADHSVTHPWQLGTPNTGSRLTSSIPFLAMVDPQLWDDFRMNSVTGAIFDVSLHLFLIAATAAVILRLERRGWARGQFSIADMLSLTAAAGMVLGLICPVRIPLAAETYLPLDTLRLFDAVMVLFAVACAVWLVVSMLLTGLGKRNDSRA
jgi:hypothetical protein